MFIIANLATLNCLIHVYQISIASTSVNPYPVIIILVKKKMSADFPGCIYSNALETTFIMEANTMIPDQTDPDGAV